MAEYLIQEETLTAIADAIRTKTGGTEELTPDQMVTEIEEIPDSLDTSDATATADQMASGATAYVNGEKLTGTATEVKSGYALGWATLGANYLKETNGNVGFRFKVNQSSAGATGILWQNDSSLYVQTPAANFGDATVEDVAAGKTFTSAAGLKVTGTGSGGGGGSNSGESSSPVYEKDVNFYDYDGTLLYSYTVEEAQALTELPTGPEHDGLVFQKWNWSLESVKALTRAMNIGALYTTDDGTTRLYIHLEEGRTSPMLGVCPNGTVTVDWGDGTDPDTLTGTSTSTVQWTPTHEYAAPGDYIIRLTVNGTMKFSGTSSTNAYAHLLRHAITSDNRNFAYTNALQRVEIGYGVTSIGAYAFSNCGSLTSVTIPDSVTSIDSYAFNYCYSISSVIIPDGVTTIGGYTFRNCYSISSVVIPDSVTSIGNYTFQDCSALTTVSIPDGVTSIGKYAFNHCCSLTSVIIPYSVTSIGTNAFNACYSLRSTFILGSVTIVNLNTFNNCYSLRFVSIPDSVTSIGNSVFYKCYSLTSVIIPGNVTSIGSSTFYSCYGVRFYDFSNHTSVPNLSATSAFTNISEDCEIRVPSALYDEWIAATNWATYADYIAAV